MTLWVWWPRVILSLALGLGLTGCLPSNPGGADEEREPYFQKGKSLVNSLDYRGAAEAFEKALEVNPRNGLAHFELGLLYEKNETDLAAAIYHFERFLRLRPASEHAEFVRQRILSCKQDLAKAISVSLAPVTQSMQRDLERLAAENRELRRQIEAWQAYYTNQARLAGQTTNAPALQSQAVPNVVRAPASPDGPSKPSGDRPPAVAPRTHIVKAGESPYSIAKKYGVKLSGLLAANPAIEPRRLKPGQSLVIPAPQGPD